MVNAEMLGKNRNPGADSIAVRMFRSTFDIAGETRAILGEHPSEMRLLGFALLANLVYSLSWFVKTQVSAEAADVSRTGQDILIYLIVALLMRTALIYALAALIGFAMKGFGGQGSLQDTRAGVFWGALVAAPFGLVISQLAVFLQLLHVQNFAALTVWLGMVPFVWYVAKGAAVANRMENSIPLFGVLSALGVVLAFGLQFLAG